MAKNKGVKYSKEYYAKKRRILQIPELGVAYIDAKLKKYAVDLIGTFQDGIRENSFNLIELKDKTIQRKQKLGYERPETPLYGKGDEQEKNSYINMLRIQKLKNGWKVKPSTGMHWSGKIKLKLLFCVHEYGTIIKIGKAYVRIPPRPALSRAHERFLKEMRKSEPAREVKKAISEYINEGKDVEMKQQIRQTDAAIQKYRIREEE